jgi:hypothetical protein
MVNEQNEPRPWEVPLLKHLQQIAEDFCKKNKQKIVFAKKGEEIAPQRTNGFADAFHYAYFGHLNLVLSPDMFWLAILQAFTVHVERNSEKLRNKFVDFAGKKTLTINSFGYPPQTAEGFEDLFFRFNSLIGENISKETFGLINPGFSTTTHEMEVVYAVTVMNSLKSYFEYCVNCVCGIRSVKLLGTSADWKKLRQKAEELLTKFEMKWWLPYLLPILEELISIFEGKSNRKFWDTSYRTLPTDRLVCYKNLGLEYPDNGKTDCLSGWIFNFSPYVSSGNSKNPFIKNKGMKTLPTFYVLHDSWKLEKTNFDTDGDKQDYLKKWKKAYDYPFDMKRFIGGLTSTELKICSSEIPRINFIIAGFTGCHFDEKSFEISPAVGWFITENRGDLE